MSNIIYIVYDDSEKDFSVINGVVEKNNSLQVQVGYFGKYADELYKMVTRQGYLVEHDEKVRADLINELVALVNSDEFKTRCIMTQLPFFEFVANEFEQVIKEQKNG